MSQQVTITIKEAEVLKRFQQATYKQGRALEQPNVVKQVYNLQADGEDTADAGLMHDSYNAWIGEAVNQVREYLTAEPTITNTDVTNIVLQMPGNWEHYAPNAPGLKYAMTELILNGMLADWYDNTKPDSAKGFRQKAELNKAQVRSIIYALKAPSVSVTSAAGSFPDENDGNDGSDNGLTG